MNSYTLADISPGLTADFTLEVTAEKMALFYEDVYKRQVLILVKGTAGKSGHLSSGRNILRAARRQKLLGL